MLLYYLVNYRLDILVLAVSTAVGMWLCHAAVRERGRAARPLLPVLFATAALIVAGCALLAEMGARRQREFLVSVFAGFGPTYARDLEQAGHARVRFGTPPDDTTYLRLIAIEKDLLRLNPLIADIYTLRRDSMGRIRFVVDSETDYDGDGRFAGERERRTPIGELFSKATPCVADAFAGQAVFEPEIITDRWGMWVSSLAPLHDEEGRVEAVVGLHFPAETWLRAIATRREFVVITGFFVIGLLLTSGTLITLMRGEIKERTETQAALQRAKEAADAAGRAKGEFLAVMSHEIRTPLTAITGYASMLEETPLNPGQQRYVRTLHRGATSLVELLNNILDYSRIEDGRLQLDIGPCAPSEVVGDVIDLLGANARDKSLELRFEDQIESGLYVATDQARLRQVVMNLVGNAVKFTATGSVIVTASWTPVSAAPSDGILSVTVADTGPGIAPEKLPKLFQMFTQADPGTARRHGGSGLGLAISKRIAEMMHGAITARSVVGKGSEFSLTLPCRRVPAAESEPPPALTDGEPLPSAAAVPARLLVVDDNPVNLDVMKGLLSRSGFDVDVADSGPAAIRLAGLHRYRAILMDISMPGMDGLEATRVIRAAPHGMETPVIAVTAATSKADRDACAAAGMREFVPKPIDRKQLLDVLMRV